MKTITIQIGNSDDKLKQRSWSEFVEKTKTTIEGVCASMYFYGCSDGSKPWQNAAFIFSIDDDFIDVLKKKLTDIRSTYSQDSIAWSESDPIFL